MLGIIVPILITYYIYKNAKENGRNAVLWAVANVAVIIGVQLLFGLTAGILIEFGIQFYGWSENTLHDWYLPINIIALVLSLTASYLIYRHVTRVPEQPFISPPPPPKFN